MKYFVNNGKLYELKKEDLKLIEGSCAECVFRDTPCKTLLCGGGGKALALSDKATSICDVTEQDALNGCIVHEGKFIILADVVNIPDNFVVRSINFEDREVEGHETELSLVNNVTVTLTEREVKDLKRIRNYFGEHDVSMFEHFAYSFIDRLLKKVKS